MQKVTVAIRKEYGLDFRADLCLISRYKQVRRY